MGYDVETCIKKLHSLNGSSQCITDITRWMEDNGGDAAQITTMMKDMFPTVDYQRKLYFFYLINSVLVHERSNGEFIYTPLFTDFIPQTVKQSLENVEKEEIAQKMLGIIRMWKDKRTIGRSMTSKILHSIPVDIFTKYPQYTDLNVYPQELLAAALTESSRRNGIQHHTSIPAPSRSMPTVIPVTDVNPLVDSMESLKPLLSEPLLNLVKGLEELHSDNSSVNRLQRKIGNKRMVLEQMQKSKRERIGDDEEEYEVRMNKKEVVQMCIEQRKKCNMGIALLEGLSDLLSIAYDTEVEHCDVDRQMLEQSSEYVQSITKNSEFLFQSTRKRDGMSLSDESKRAKLYY